MDETIKIRSVDKTNWSNTLQGFQLEQVEHLLEVYSSEGQVVGNICESVEGKYYINGQPDVDYASLQAATGALIKRKG